MLCHEKSSVAVNAGKPVSGTAVSVATLPLRATNHRAHRGHDTHEFQHSFSTSRALPRIRSVSLPLTRSLRGLRDVPQPFRPRAVSRAGRCRSCDPRCRECRRSGGRHPDAADRRRRCGSAGAGAHEHSAARDAAREVPGAAGDRVCVSVSRGDARIAGTGGVWGAARGAARLRRSAGCVPRDR